MGQRIQIAGLVLALMACAACRQLAPDGVYKGDKFLYQSELAITTSYDLVHTFVTWEHDNRTVLAKWPQIGVAAKKMRTEYPLWHKSAIALHDAYEAAPGGETRLELERVLALLRTAMLEAASYMATAANEN